MSTNPANEQLSAYLDGELEDAEAASIEAALSGDAELRAELDRLKNVQRLLRTHGRARAPEGFAARVIAATAEADKVVAFPWWRRPFGIPVEGVLIAAAAALVLIVALPRSEDVLPEAAPTQTDPAVQVPKDAASADAENKDEGIGEGDAGVADGNPSPKDAGPTSEKNGPDGIADAEDAPMKGNPEPIAKPDPRPRPNTKSTEVPDTYTKGVLTTEGVGEADPDEGGVAGAGSMDNAATSGELGSTAGKSEGSSTVEDVTLTAAGLTAQVYSDDEAILGQIQAILARYDGRVLDASGQVLTTGMLSLGETVVILDIPQEHMSTVNKSLKALGVELSTTSDKMANSANFRLPLRIVITGSEPSTQQAAPPNAAKQRMYDNAESVDQAQ